MDLLDLDSLPTLLNLLGNTVGGIADLFVSGDSSFWPQLVSLVGTFVADMENFNTNYSELEIAKQEAEERSGLVTTPVLATMIPHIAQAVGIFIAVAFKYAAMNILLTIKSFMIRTVLLGLFFFVLLPLGKIAVIKTGLLSMAPSILSRASGGRSDDDTSAVESAQGLVEFLLWEMYKLGEGFFDDIDNLIVS